MLQFLAGNLAGLLGIGGYASAVEPGFRLVTTRYRIRAPRWPATAPDLTIAVVADIHAVEPFMPAERVARICAAANALRPDLIAMLGDFTGTAAFHTRQLAPEEWSAPLATLRAPLGVYTIIGNHDWWTDIEAVRRGLARTGIPVLENDAVKIEARGHRFWLAGIGSQIAFRLAANRFRGVDDLPGTLAKVSDEDPVVLLAHEPDIFVRVPDRVSLTLAGHTHGGQVWLPGIGRPVIPSRYGQRFAYGHVAERGRHMVVSAGLGCSTLPVRFLVPPEITVVTLTGR